jgi:anti-anti-sigma factor
MTTTQLRLTCAMTAEGRALVTLAGELDMASSGHAFDSVRHVIDRRRVPVVVDVGGVTFCDVRGLSALVRMSSYAQAAGCTLAVTAPSPHLLKIMRITGLDDCLAVDVAQPAVRPVTGSVTAAR